MVLSCSPVCSPKVRGERRGGPGCWVGAACAARRGRELGSAELGDAAASFHHAGIAFGQVWLFILVGVDGGGIVALQLEVWSGNNGTKELLYKVPIQARVCLPCCSSAPCSQSWESWLSRAFSCSLLCSLLALSPSLYEEPASFGWPGGAERLHRASAHPSLSAVGTSEFVLLRLQGRKMQRGNLGTKVAAGHPLLECPGHTPDT